MNNWIGQTLNNRYEIKRRLGYGGMASVYLADDPNLGRKVAIKLTHTHLAEEPAFQERFKEEAQAVANLNHPHIVQVHDFVKVDNICFITKDAADNESICLVCHNNALIATIRNSVFDKYY